MILKTDAEEFRADSVTWVAYTGNIHSSTVVRVVKAVLLHSPETKLSDRFNKDNLQEGEAGGATREEWVWKGGGANKRQNSWDAGINKQERREERRRGHAYMSELISAHCLSDMCDARDSMMSNSSGWLSDRRLGSLDTFGGRKGEQNE